MTSATQIATTTQVYRVYIRTTPEQVWDAIVKPEWTAKYGYGGLAEYDLRPGGAFRQRASAAMKAYAPGTPDVIVDGEVVEADPPRRLVQTFRMLMDPSLVEEGFTRLTHEIEPAGEGVVRLTVIHELESAPRLAVLVSGGMEETGAGGGWAWILSDLKSLLETGAKLAD
jgi:uncharacterized protein YndB with AHSA1/START domain